MLTFLFTSLATTYAEKPTKQEPIVQISSTNDYKQITLHYSLNNSRKIPDLYVIKRDGKTIYEGSTQTYTDTNLHSDTFYSYTVEAWYRDTLLAATSYITSTYLIPVSSLSVSTTTLPDNIVQVYWNPANSVFSADRYQVWIGMELIYEGNYPDQAVTLPSLAPGNYTVQVKAWYQDEYIGTGSQEFQVQQPEPISIASIQATSTLNTDFSADIHFQLEDSVANPDHYIVYLNGNIVFNGTLEDSSVHIQNLNPSQQYSVKIEAYSQMNLIADGSCSFTAPHLIEGSYELIYWNPDTSDHELNLLFSYDHFQQTPDQMVITKKSTFYNNNQLEEPLTEVILYNGAPIQSLVEHFNPWEATNYYYIANYKNGVLVGVGYFKIPNFIYY